MKNYTLMMIAFMVSIGLLGCSKKQNISIGETARQVRGAVVQMKDVPNEINGFGTLSFLKKIDVAAPQDGVIKSIPFREGDVVKSGNLIIELENQRISLAVGRAENSLSQSQSALELARSRLLEGEFSVEAQILNIEKAGDELAQAKRNYEEQERKHNDQEALYEAGGITEDAIRSSRFSLETQRENIRLQEKELEIRRIGFRDQDLRAAGMEVPSNPEEKKRAFIRLSTATLRAELAAAEASLDAARKELQAARLAQTELRITSPAPGTIGARYLEVGERVKQEDKILTLIDTESLYAVFPVRESDTLLLSRGMEAIVRVDGTGGTYGGSVDLVSPSADSQSFTFSVRVLIPPEVVAASMVSGEATLKPGMFARVSIILGPPRKVVTVPESALFNKRNNEGSVFVVSGNTLSERTVSIGISLGEDRETLSGVSIGEVVVLRPDANLKEGEYVSVVD
jgi:RND family efflux transporter MFP subunit